MYDIIVIGRERNKKTSKLYEKYEMHEAEEFLEDTVNDFKLKKYKEKKRFVLMGNYGEESECYLVVLQKGFLFWKKELSIFIKQSTDYENEKTTFELYEELKGDIIYIY